MRILLIEPSYNWPHKDKPWSPWGKLQLAAYLKKHGHEVHIMDNAFFQGTDYGIRHTVGVEIKPDIIGIGGMTMQHNDTKHIAGVVRDMYADHPDDRPLLVGGGVHFTFCPDDAAELFDLVAIGEGEETMLEICNRYKDTGYMGGEDYEDIRSIGYKKPGETTFTYTPRRPLMDPEDICQPAYELVQPWLTQYNDGFITGEKAPMIMTGRGCPYNCQFCGAPRLYQRTMRMFPIEGVIENMKRVSQLYNGVKSFRIMDDTFAASHKRVEEFGAAVLPAFDGKASMTCLTHVKTAKENTMKLLKDIGFWIVAFGFESGNDDVLKAINKGVTVAESAEAARVARAAGLCVEGLFMMGCVGETEQSCLDTIEFAKSHNPPDYGVNATWNWFQFATPFPGSKFYDEAEEHGTILTKNYDEYHHQRPVYVPHGMTAAQLMRLREKAFREVR